MTTKSTPGPWEITSDQLQGTDNLIVWGNMQTGGPQPAVCGIYPLRDAREEQEANARLIVAAPDMLKVLKRAMEFAEGDGRNGFQWHEVRVAIAQAETGSTP